MGENIGIAKIKAMTNVQQILSSNCCNKSEITKFQGGTNSCKTSHTLSDSLTCFLKCCARFENFDNVRNDLWFQIYYCISIVMTILVLGRPSIRVNTKTMAYAPKIRLFFSTMCTSVIALLLLVEIQGIPFAILAR